MNTCINLYVTLLLSLGLSFGLSGCTISGDVHATELVPALKSAGSPAYFTNNPTIKVVLTFNRPPDVLKSDDFDLTNATLAQVTAIDSKTYEVTLTPQGQGVVSLRLPQGAALGKRGEESEASTTFEVHFDDIIPTINTLDFDPQNVSFSTSPIIKGNTEPEAILTLYNSITCSGPVLADTKADKTTGDYSLTPATALTTDGDYAWSLKSEDAAGNIYCYPYPLAYHLDRTAPSVPTISLVNGSIEDNPIAINVSSCVDANQNPDSFYQVAFIPDGGVAPAIGDAAWVSCAAGVNTTTLTGDGAHTINMWVRDEAGNVAQSNTISVTLDTVTPSLTIPIANSLNRNSSQTTLAADADVVSDEEGGGAYSLVAATSPKCSDYGSVQIDASTGEFSFTPTAHYFNKDGATSYNGGPCNIKVQFADQVSPTPHIITKEMAVSVDFVDEVPAITAWPGTNGTVAEKCGNKCFANAVFDVSFTANPGGNATFPDPQNLTCWASSADTYYVDVASCDITGNNGTLALQMGSAHALVSDVTQVTLYVSDGVSNVSKTFNVHVDNYVMSMYPALVASTPLSCLLCHANVQADIVSDFGVAKTSYNNASSILGMTPLANSHIQHTLNNTYGFSVTGSLYMPDITVTDKNFIKQATGNPNSAPINLKTFLLNAWNYYPVITDYWGGIITDSDGYAKVDPTPVAQPAALPSNRLLGGIQTKSSITIRAPSDAEIIALDSSLNASTVAYVFKGPNSKPGLSGLQIVNLGNGNFVKNNGTIVCYGSIIISGTLYLKNPDIQTDDVGCSIYVAGSVFIETDRANAITYLGGTSSPTLQITSSRNLYMGVNMYDIKYQRGGDAFALEASKIVNAANPSGLRDAVEGATTIKSNGGDSGSLEYMRCPLHPGHAAYLDAHYVSNGNYTACDASVDSVKCAYADQIFANWRGVVTGYNHYDATPIVYNSATNTLTNMISAYESMCRYNSGWQMANYANYGWSWNGSWAEDTSLYGSATINTIRRSTTFNHFRVNAKAVHSRYAGTFRGSVIAPYALFAIGNLVFQYDTTLNAVVPFPRLMVPNPIFDVQ
ncbi:Ig-like domain-containing protein [Bdellovibrio sp. NC01]|uniref:Ig-like domain-containing protein n=1 Tax=Bdellovibrio sp. NC01 TaxID=2220073 RepID=UPI0011586E47|nr:Ig-like domain-containing protein [Bdellovibrio sp. NC01]QDK37992.1 hemagglutinin [Bdellovibrio sp. NC01]